jgi:hypothetical protein
MRIKKTYIIEPLRQSYLNTTLVTTTNSLAGVPGIRVSRKNTPKGERVAIRPCSLAFYMFCAPNDYDCGQPPAPMKDQDIHGADE